MTTIPFFEDFQQHVIALRQEKARLDRMHADCREKTREGNNFLVLAGLAANNMRAIISTFYEGKIDTDGLYKAMSEITTPLNDAIESVYARLNQQPESSIEIDDARVATIAEARQLTQSIAECEELIAEDMVNVKLVADLLHNVRGPAAGIIGLIYLYEEGMQTDNIADIISLAIDQISSEVMISSAFLHEQELKPAEFDLNEMMENLRRTYSGLCQNGQILEVEIHGDPPQYLNYVGEVVMSAAANFLRNAIDLSSKDLSNPARIRLSATWDAAQNELNVAVADNGPGFDPANTSKLFFSGQLPNKHGKTKQGQGIGLTSVANNIRAIGGSFGAYSSGYDQGALFWISVPAIPIGLKPGLGQNYDVP